MEINACLRDAIIALDLSSWEARYGATALVIVLLEKIWREEAKDSEMLDKYHNWLRYGDWISGQIDLREIDYAISMLYGTFGLREYRYLGVSNHLRKIDAPYHY